MVLRKSIRASEGNNHQNNLTSKSNSSGPANGKRTYGKMFIPGAVKLEGSTATSSDSGYNKALWAGTWNAQCLYYVNYYVNFL